MADSNGLLSRIATLFGRKNRIEEHLSHDEPAPSRQLVEARTSIFRPWARQNQALQSMSEGFVTLTQLMSGIKENLEKQNLRQDELLRFLSNLPAVIEQIPEANRSQAESLKLIYEQLGKQNQAQSTLGEVLNRICDTSGEQKKLIDQLNDQLDGIRQTDAAISSNIATVGTAMSSLGQSSQASAQALEKVQAGLAQRDEAIARLLEKQNQRFNMIFWASIVLSITTLLSLAGLAYLLVRPG